MHPALKVCQCIVALFQGRVVVIDHPPQERLVARAFRVALGALIADSKLPDVLGDQAMFGRWKALDSLPQGERQCILDVLDSPLHDAQARIAFAKPG